MLWSVEIWIRIFEVANYLTGMCRVEFAPFLPTRGTAVPAGPDWIHEIKHDGYRLAFIGRASAFACSSATVTTGPIDIR